MTYTETLYRSDESENVLARRTVFISHAHPEDNEFTAWLGTRLIGAGYYVWSDLLRLIGGEPFWRDIGDAIKDHAAVVVLVLSRSSVLKPGVLDEIALAVATARKLQNPKFIIPVRLDDLPFVAARDGLAALCRATQCADLPWQILPDFARPRDGE